MIKKKKKKKRKENFIGKSNRKNENKSEMVLEKKKYQNEKNKYLKKNYCNFYEVDEKSKLTSSILLLGLKE